MGLFLRKNHLFRCYGWLFLLNWIDEITWLNSYYKAWNTRKKGTKRLKHTESGLFIFAIDVKVDGSGFEEKSFEMLQVTFSSKLDWGTCIISIAKTASMKIGAWKLVSAIFYHFLFFSSSHRPSKTMKNIFYFILKALFVLEIFKFL